MNKKKTKRAQTKSMMLDQFRRQGASEMLALGRALYEHETAAARKRDGLRPVSEEDLAAIEGAEQRLVATIPVSGSSQLRQALGLKRNSEKIDPVELRLVCYVLYAALLTQDRGARLESAVHAALPGAEPDELLDAQFTCGGLCTRNVLRYADDNWMPVLLPGERLVHFLFGASSSSLVSGFHAHLFTPQDHNPTQQVPSASGVPSFSGNTDQAAKPNASMGPRRLPSTSGKRLYEKIRRRVIGLDEQVRLLAGRISLHLLRAELIKSNRDPRTPNECLLFVGPSGSGKTYLAETMGEMAGLPYGAVSATDITSEGYVGLSVDDALLPMIQAAKGNVNHARFGICFVDEWDKKASNQTRHTGQLDVSGRAVQQAFLRIMEGCTTQVGGRRSAARSTSFNSQGTCFIFGGAFVGLDMILCGEGIDRPPIGFGVEAAGPVFQDSRLYEALVQYGMIPEFLNRLTGIVRFPDPTLEQLIAISTAPDGLLASYNSLVAGTNANLFVTGDAISLAAEYALETRTFARGIRSIMSHVVGEIVFEQKKGVVRIDETQVRAVIEGLAGLGSTAPRIGQAASL